MKTTIKRIFAWVLCAALCFGMTVMHANAQTSEAPKILVTPSNEITIAQGDTQVVYVSPTFSGVYTIRAAQTRTCSVTAYLEGNDSIIYGVGNLTLNV
ncbi:MAG: hypothetical protein IJT44_01550 [Clostridia bacterium]|nr:hypothetical protein [Clostridia bacterium]